MKRAMLITALVLWGLSTAAGEPSKKAKNLVPNGDFERGKGAIPESWQRPDELTTFWVKSPGREGRAIKIDTDVLASQFRERQDEISKAEEARKEPPPPPGRRQTKEPKYDTVAGLDGVLFASAEIRADRRKTYKLQVDVKVEGQASPKVWVKGYAQVTSQGKTRLREVWKRALDCEKASSEWKTFGMVFQVNQRLRYEVEHFRIVLYPYWPPATYHFDNVHLTEVMEGETEVHESGGGSGDAERDEKSKAGPKDARSPAGKRAEKAEPPGG